MKWFSVWCRKRGLELIADVGARDLWAYIAHLKQAAKYEVGHPLHKPSGRLSPATVARIFRSLRAFFNWAYLMEYIERNPIEKLKKPKEPDQERRGLTEEEIEKVVAATQANDAYCLGLRNKAIFLGLIDTMCRVAEFCRLTVESLESLGNGHGRAKIIQKGESEHIIFFSPVSWGAICEYVEKEHPYGSGHLFINRYGKPLTDGGIRQMLKNLGERAGLEKNLYPHRLRRTGATLRALAGCNSKILQRLGGWKDAATMARYISGIEEERLSKAHSKTSPLNFLAAPND